MRLHQFKTVIADILEGMEQIESPCEETPGAYHDHFDLQLRASLGLEQLPESPHQEAELLKDHVSITLHRSVAIKMYLSIDEACEEFKDQQRKVDPNSEYHKKMQNKINDCKVAIEVFQGLMNKPT